MLSNINPLKIVNMTKKQYVRPEIRMYQIEAANILAGSYDYANSKDDPGELYDQIPFHEGGYCKKPE